MHACSLRGSDNVSLEQRHVGSQATVASKATKYLFSVLTSTCLLAGCHSRVPPEFQDVSAAWDDGCRSATGQPGYAFIRDRSLYDTDPRYREAWDHGYERCADKPRRYPIGGPDGEAGTGAKAGAMPAAKSGGVDGGMGMGGAKGGH